MEEFEIGQIFEGEYPPEAAEWCNNRGDCYIEEIEPVVPEENVEEIEVNSEIIEPVRRFEIKLIPAPTEEELKQREIESIKSELDELDLKSIRALRAGETDYIELYEAQAQELRARLAELGETVE